MSEFFSMERMITAFPKMISCLPVTLEIAFLSAILGFSGAIVIAFIQSHRVPVVNQLLKLYISFMRGTPGLVQILLCYFALPAVVEAVFGLDINRWERVYFVIIAFAANEAAFMSEVFRSAIMSVPRSQTDAGLSVGLSRLQTFFLIVLPQAFRICIPPIGTELVVLIQASSIAYMVGVVDMVGKGNMIGYRTNHYLEPYIIAALVFMVLSLIFRGIFKLIDMRLARSRAKIV